MALEKYSQGRLIVNTLSWEGLCQVLGVRCAVDVIIAMVSTAFDVHTTYQRKLLES